MPASLQLMDLSGDLLKLIEHGIYSENTSILLFDMAALYGYGNEYTIRWTCCLAIHLNVRG